MNICVIGAGNIGTYLASFIGRNKENKVWLHTSKVNMFDGYIDLIEEEKNIESRVKIHKVVDKYREGVEDADIILVTYPSFMLEEALNEIVKYIKPGAAIGIIPGFGGVEFFKEKFLEKGCIFFGSQRVPSITRLKEYGKSVYLKERNPFMNISIFPKEKSNEIAEIMTKLIDIPCIPLGNYLAITLSPSNPIFHPSRLYELFKDYNDEKVYKEHSLFYEGWGDFASDCLLNLDKELEEVTKALIKDPSSDFERIKNRFRIEIPSELTEKIRTAPGFIGIKTPMIKCEEGYKPNLDSRYFIEDLEFGTCIIKGFAEVLNVQTPLTDEIIMWGQKLLNKEYLIDGKLIGKDSKKLLVPKNLNLNTRESILNYYK